MVVRCRKPGLGNGGECWVTPGCAECEKPTSPQWEVFQVLLDIRLRGKKSGLGSPGFKALVLSGSKSRLLQAAGNVKPYCIVA